MKKFAKATGTLDSRTARFTRIASPAKQMKHSFAIPAKFPYAALACTPFQPVAGAMRRWHTAPATGNAHIASFFRLAYEN